MRKVLWFTNCPLPDSLGTGNGAWMSSLAQAMVERGGVQLGVATHGPSRDRKCFERDGIVQWFMPIRDMKFTQMPPSKKMIDECQRIVDEFRPDLIHIHGTEQYFGLLTGRHHFTGPSVISIQGLIHICRQYELGGLPLHEIIRNYTLRDLVRWDGMLQRRKNWAKADPMERETLASNRYFIGRTMWDRAHVWANNNKAVYFHCDELMRPEFYKVQRDESTVIPYSVFSSVSGQPLKGRHLLLESVGLLKREFPRVTLRLAGPPINTSWRAFGYDRYLRRLIDRYQLHNNINYLGPLTAKKLCEELSRAEVAVIPSLVENSANSLAEVMLAGTPGVVALAGGLPSMVRDGETALCFPLGDSAVLAECIRELFSNHALAHRLARKARQVALIRHDKARIATRTLQIYDTVINGLPVPEIDDSLLNDCY